MTVALRRATPADCTKVLALRKRLYTESAQANGNGVISNEQEWRAFHDILGFLLDPYSILFLAETDKEPVGMLALQAGQLTGFYKDAGVVVTWLYVHPAYRDGNVLRNLLRMAEKAVVQDRAVPIQATIRVDNADMMEGAKRLGYTPIATIVEKVMHGREFGHNPSTPVHAERS